MTTLTPDSLAALRKLAEAATPGPWCSVEYTGFVCIQASRDFGDRDLLNEKSIHFPGSENFRYRDNGAYIAAANPQTMQALLAELEAARRERDEARRCIEAAERQSSARNDLVVCALLKKEIASWNK